MKTLSPTRSLNSHMIKKAKLAFQNSLFDKKDY